MDSSKYNQNIVEQLSQLRDLLIVIERSGDTAPDVLYKIAVEKSQHITALVEAWRDEANPAPVEIPAEYAMYLNEQDVDAVVPLEEPQEDVEKEAIDISVEQPSVEVDFIDVVASVPEQEELVEESQEDVEEDEYIAPFVEDEPVGYQPQTDEQPQPEYCVQEVPVEIDPEEGTYEECDDTPIATTEEEELSYVEDEEVVVVSDEVAVVDFEVVESDNEIAEFDIQIGFDDDDDDDDTDFDDDDDDDEGDDVNLLLEEEAVMDDFYNQGEPFESETITVGDMMSMRQAKELRKAFSLNDRFRFRRELFGNSDINMNDTLNLIDTMSSFEEAVEYLTQDMGWTIDELVVQEFLQLIERHFKQK